MGTTRDVSGLPRHVVLYCFQTIYGKGKVGSQRFDFEFNRSAFFTTPSAYAELQIK